MYLLKHIKLDKDAILIGRPKAEDLAGLAGQGYRLVLDIMPEALREKALARKVRAAGMKYMAIPVESCDLAVCSIEEPWVARFSRFVNTSDQYPFIIYTDDEALGLSLMVMAKLFLLGTPAREVIAAIERLGLSLKGRKDIKRFIKEYYQHYRPAAKGLKQ
jgi:protein tyrosine phosphatase (PTP) superfamily phosphohydrolase (DUF442 family)